MELIKDLFNFNFKLHELKLIFVNYQLPLTEEFWIN